MKSILNKTIVRVLCFVLWFGTLLMGSNRLYDSHANPVYQARPTSQQNPGYTPLQKVISSFESELASDVARDAVGGISAGIVLGDDLIWNKAFGWADNRNQKLYRKHTIGRTGSISKSVTAILMMQLVEAGMIGLDAPVREFLPEIEGVQNPPVNMKPVTFRHLASHTAGFIREPNLQGAASGPIAIWEQKILDSIPATVFMTPPGSKYSYSNIDFGILGLALSRTAGKSFFVLMEEYIFKPLQMENTFFIVPEASWKTLATGYAVSKNGVIDAQKPALEHAGRGYKVPNGGIYSTVPDLAKLISALTETSTVRILSRKTLEEMFAFQTPESDTTGYGLGFFIRLFSDGTKIVGHSGSVSGYNAYFGFDPVSKLGIVLLRNYIPGTTHLRKRGEAVLYRLIKAVGKCGVDHIEALEK